MALTMLANGFSNDKTTIGTGHFSIFFSNDKKRKTLDILANGFSNDKYNKWH